METRQQRALRILAADDSVVMRGILAKLFELHAGERRSELPPMELCGVAQDGVACLEAVDRLRPDVLVLDLEMPKLNGLEVLDSLRVTHPELPVIMCSAYTEHGARSTLEALARGASDYITKPAEQRNFAEAMMSLSQQLLPRIAALARNFSRNTQAHEGTITDKSPRADAVATRSHRSAAIEVVVIGLSTGGPSALEQLLPRLPRSFPVPVLIVQHMPKLFTGALAERLDRCCELTVQEAYEDAPLRPGTVWLAPGDSHLEVASRAAMSSDGGRDAAVRGGQVRLHRKEPLNHCRPSVDYLFFSAARIYGPAALALVMTGMGSDGLDGARAVHRCGGVVLAQDQASSAVWGMPGRVAGAGIASATLPLSQIAEALRQRVNAGRAAVPSSQTRTTAGVLAGREAEYGLL